MSHVPFHAIMKATIYLLFLSEVFTNCRFDFVSSSTDRNKTFLMNRSANEFILKRSKRYLIFEKGATLTFQGNIAKSIIPPAPRGLNMITEYTLVYDLPTDLQLFQKKHKKKNTKATAMRPTRTTMHPHYDQHLRVPFSHDYFYNIHPEYFNESLIKRKNFYFKENAVQRKCYKKKFYNFNKNYSNVCLKRIKRNGSWSLSKLSTSQRMFYDLIEKWSLIHGFLARYCFMRTLCESLELLLPYGHSLLHDIIHIFLGYTKPWAFHHKIFGRSLRQRHSIEECAKLYGPYCRVSWFDFLTNVVHGSSASGFVR